VIVTYNSAGTIDRALASIRPAHESGELECVVVDNASADASAEALEERFPDIKIIRSKENIGFGRGNNLGATYAEGDALFLLNTDTIVRPGSIERLHAKLFEDDRRGIVGPFLQNPDGSYQCSMLSFPTVWRTFCVFFWLDRLFPRTPLFADGMMTHVDPYAEHDVDVINGAAMMIRRDLYNTIGGFDPEYFMYYEESDLCMRVAKLGYTAHYTPNANVLHLLNQSSRTHPWWFHHILRRSRMIYARKHMSPLQRAAMSAVVHAAYAFRLIVYPCIGLIKPRFRSMWLNILKSYLRVDSPFIPRKNASA
jgi:GT2 family glycosyltransferase